MSDRRKLVAAGRGDQALDLLIKGSAWSNVFTGEIYPADIGIYDGWSWRRPGRKRLVPGAPKVYPADGKFAVPGLMDTHIHIESSMMTPAGYARRCCHAAPPPW